MVLLGSSVIRFPSRTMPVGDHVRPYGVHGHLGFLALRRRMINALLVDQASNTQQKTTRCECSHQFSPLLHIFSKKSRIEWKLRLHVLSLPLCKLSTSL